MALDTKGVELKNVVGEVTFQHLGLCASAFFFFAHRLRAGGGGGEVDVSFLVVRWVRRESIFFLRVSAPLEAMRGKRKRSGT